MRQPPKTEDIIAWMRGLAREWEQRAFQLPDRAEYHSEERTLRRASDDLDALADDVEAERLAAAPGVRPGPTLTLRKKVEQEVDGIIDSMADDVADNGRNGAHSGRHTDALLEVVEKAIRGTL